MYKSLVIIRTVLLSSVLVQAASPLRDGSWVPRPLNIAEVGWPKTVGATISPTVQHSKAAALTNGAAVTMSLDTLYLGGLDFFSPQLV
ncbi:MAG: hypothetical protein J3Q66DRAFT_320334 [Benniella sp.]|nr:MAG: hypothetical protein J3Q66DRAFT_320334 [Benniella sp.]